MRRDVFDIDNVLCGIFIFLESGIFEIAIRTIFATQFLIFKNYWLTVFGGSSESHWLIIAKADFVATWIYHQDSWHFNDIQLTLGL